MNSQKEWMAEISEIDELMGKKPRYPHTLIQSHLQKELSKTNKVISNSSSEIREAIENSTSDISGTLENGFNLMVEKNSEGFEKVNDNLSNINIEISQGFENVVNQLSIINSTLGWGFSKIIELSKQRNILLDNIIGLLNIPDIEKVRKSYIEKGLNSLKKSTIDVTLLDDAKRYFEKALEIEPNDYYVLYNLGIIHLYSKKHLDFEKAKKYFLKAGKYSKVDIMFKKVKYGTHPSSFKNNINPRTIASYSFLYAARCYYNLSDYEMALKTVIKGQQLAPNISEIAYDTSKYFMVNNKVNEGIYMLYEAIKLDRFITLRVRRDTDFISHKEVPIFLRALRIKKNKEAYNFYSQCELIIRKDSIEMVNLNIVKKYLQKNTFLDAMSALDML